ncbi:hypothetical protein [Phocaeicola plebeius]|uniref:hypothetical protein n=1 Tax=Phocaeicola plebeius TaxID=310297 RepID=UPI0026F23285|nr:hypothetical protein [Phocaeicola plebeius]
MKPFNLQHIEDLEFYTNEDIDYTTLDPKKVSMSMSNELKVSNSLADMFMTIEYKYKETSTLLLKQKVKFTFRGDFTDCEPNDKDNNEEWKNKLKEISLEFMIVTLGTLRGMIYVKVRNNLFLSQKLIPVIPKEFLQIGINDSVNKSTFKENHQG